MVIEARQREPGGRELDLLLHKIKTDVVPFNRDHAEIARIAWRKYGKGPRGRAQFRRLLRLRCFAVSGEPLLFKGTDFVQTDVKPAMRP